MRGCCALVATMSVTGCGHINFDPRGDGGSVGNGDTGSDAPATPRCDPAVPFGTPTLLPGNVNDVAADDLTFKASTDELRAVFFSTRQGGGDLFEASRPTTADVFTAAPIAELNTSSFLEARPALSPDGLTLLFSSDRPGGQGAEDLYLATRPDRATPFTLVGLATPLNTPSQDEEPGFRAGTNEIYFTSDRSGDPDIYMGTLTGTTFSLVGVVSGFASAETDGDPVISVDGLTMLFRSGRTPALGNQDIWSATRATTADAFGSFVDEVGLSSALLDGPNWLSPDGCVLYLSSSRGGATGDIYVATRP